MSEEQYQDIFKKTKPSDEEKSITDEVLSLTGVCIGIAFILWIMTFIGDLT